METQKKNGLKVVAESLNNQFSETQLGVIKNTVAKGTNNTELAYFLYTAQSIGLNPLNKEIWCYKDHKENLIVFSGRDGFLKKAQQDKRWNGIVTSEVRENDLFEIDIPNGQISHKPNYKESRGKIIGAYCYIKPKDCDVATIEWVDVAPYDKGNYIWKTHKADMIKKVAETHALKKAFGISGIQSEYDFTIQNGKAKGVDNEKTELEQKRQQVIDALEQYQGTDKDEIQIKCRKAVQEKTESIEFYDEILKKIGNEKA